MGSNKAIQERINKQTSSKQNISKLDFSIYDDFFALRNKQLKKLDQMLNNLSTRKREILIKADDINKYPEAKMLINIEQSFDNFQKKLDKNDPLQKDISNAIDKYNGINGTLSEYQMWLMTDDSDAKNMAESKRKAGDDILNNLLKILKQKGYDGRGIINSGLNITTTPKSDEIVYKSVCKRISYKLLNKNVNSYIGDDIYFRGKIEQAGVDGKSDWFRISVTSLGYGIYTDTIWVTIQKNTDFVEGDVVSFWGEVNGKQCYRSQANFNICIPSVDALYMSKSKR